MEPCRPTIIVSCCVLTAAVSPLAAQQSAKDQRAINSVAARLEHARRTILDAPGLRKHDEGLPEYFLRIYAPWKSATVPMDKWKPTLFELASARQAIASFQIPASVGQEPDALKVRVRVKKALIELPLKVETAEKAVQGNGTELAKAITRAVYAVIEARNALKDLRPK